MAVGDGLGVAVLPAGGEGVGRGVCFGVAVGMGVGVDTDPGLAVALGLGLGVAGVAVGATVGWGVAVAVAVGVGEGGGVDKLVCAKRLLAAARYANTTPKAPTPILVRDNIFPFSLAQLGKHQPVSCRCGAASIFTYCKCLDTN